MYIKMYVLCDCLQTSVEGHFKSDYRHGCAQGRNVMDLVIFCKTIVVGHFKWDSRHAWLHGRNRITTTHNKKH